MRATGPVPADAPTQQALLAYASDMSLLDTALLPHGRSWGSNVQMASLDHAMWFHRPFREPQRLRGPGFQSRLDLYP
jgi:acyl-CoA thioesterase-2